MSEVGPDSVFEIKLVFLSVAGIRQANVAIHLDFDVTDLFREPINIKGVEVLIREGVNVSTLALRLHLNYEVIVFSAPPAPTLRRVELRRAKVDLLPADVERNGS